MANATVSVSTTLTCNLQSVQWLSTGDYVVTFAMVDAAGVVKRVRYFTAKGDGSGVYDEAGNVVAATTPAGILSSLSSLKTNIDAALTSAAGAGKFTL